MNIHFVAGFRGLILAVAALYLISSQATEIMAQGGFQVPGQTGGGGGLGQGGTSGLGGGTGGLGGGTGGMGAGQSSNVSQGAGNYSPITAPENINYIPTTNDRRNQGFVGATAQRVQNFGFVGSASDRSGPPTTSGQSWGGGVNSSLGGGSRQAGGIGGGQAGLGGTGMGARTGGLGGNTNTFNTFGGLGGRGNQLGGLGGFGNFGGLGGFGQQMFGGMGGNQNAGGLRGEFNPVFMSNSPPVQIDRVPQQFNASFAHQPASQYFAGQYQVQMDGSTAVVTGRVASQADANQLISQLRLQPGIYKIENQLEVAE